MRINFDVIGILKKVISLEKKILSEDVLKLIVRLSEGSVRDSLSLLDRVLLSAGENENKLDLNSAQKIFGYFDKSYLIDLMYELLEGNEEKVLELYQNIYNQGIEPKLFVNNFLEIIYFFKNHKNINDLTSSLEFTESDVKRIKDLSKKVDNRTILLFWEFSINILSEINLISNQHLSVEMILIRLMYINKKNSTKSKNLVEENEKNKKISIDKKDLNELDKDKPQNKTINQIKYSLQEQEKIAVDENKLSNKTKINSLSDLVSICIAKKEIKLKYELENNINLISFRNKNIEISFNENLDKNFIKNLTSKLLDWTGERWIITLSKKTGSETLNQIKIKNKDCDFEKLRNSSHIKKL